MFKITVAASLLAVSTASADTLPNLHAKISALLENQPVYAVQPTAGEQAGAIWVARIAEYTGQNCRIGWLRDFQFAVTDEGPAAHAMTLNQIAGGSKQFWVDMSMVERVEATDAAPNALAEVDYHPGEIMFFGPGILSGNDQTAQSGILIHSADARQQMLELTLEVKRICQTSARE